MSYVIRYYGLVGQALFSSEVPEGAYLKSFDPEHSGGIGLATWTADAKQALLFETGAAALDFYRTVPASMPTRPDGRPNRPLAAFSVLIDQVPEAAS